jgi:hypothetical protein
MEGRVVSDENVRAIEPLALGGLQPEGSVGAIASTCKTCAMFYESISITGAQI